MKTEIRTIDFLKNYYLFLSYLGEVNRKWGRFFKKSLTEY